MPKRKDKRIADVEQAHGFAILEDEARTYPDLSWLVVGAGAYFCRPCRWQGSVAGKFAHDDQRHPERVARRTVVVA